MPTQVEKEKFVAALLWLECKQVLRGNTSEMFPDLDAKSAAQIRGLGSVDKVQEWITASSAEIH